MSRPARISSTGPNAILSMRRPTSRSYVDRMPLLAPERRFRTRPERCDYSSAGTWSVNAHSMTVVRHSSQPHKRPPWNSSLPAGLCQSLSVGYQSPAVRDQGKWSAERPHLQGGPIPVEGRRSVATSPRRLAFVSHAPALPECFSRTLERRRKRRTIFRRSDGQERACVGELTWLGKPRPISSIYAVPVPRNPCQDTWGGFALHDGVAPTFIFVYYSSTLALQDIAKYSLAGPRLAS
jgi:hypothetical protein